MLLWKLKDYLSSLLRQRGFQADLEWQFMIYGSVLNSICTREESDLDMSLIISSNESQLALLDQIK